jgi:hypothetical protein
MRFAWTFLAGLTFAGFVFLATSPLLLLGAGVGAWVKRGQAYSALSGESVFGVRVRDGRLDGRLVNVNFRMVMVPVAGDPRPRRLLLRLAVTDGDAFASGPAEGRVRLDAWPLNDADDINKAAMYTIVAPGRSASIEDDSTLVVEHGIRRSVYALASGTWLYDTDAVVATFSLEGERRRVVAVATAEDDMPAGSVAVLTYATNQTVLKRVLVTASDPARARLLRSSVSMTRAVARMEDSTRRILDLPLPSGTVRIPMNGDDLDLAHAQLPAGLGLAELKAWR